MSTWWSPTASGNVVLKTLEGGMKALVKAILAVRHRRSTREAGNVLLPALLPLYGRNDPATPVAPCCSGLNEPCIISHGSSSATAIVSTVKVAAGQVDADLVGAIARTIRPEAGEPGPDAG